MSPPESIDPLFWPLVIFAVVFAASLVAIVVVVMVMSRRSPGHHPQVTGHQGTNSYDASTTTSIRVGKLNVGSPHLSGERSAETRGEQP